MFSSLLEAIHQGDWQRASRLVDVLAATAPPSDLEQLRDYLENLREALIAARASRSHLTLKLNRIRAAAKFLAAGKSAGPRQNFADSAES
ncbi:MAG TPA: hypothetical protein VEF06_15585 [Bryobacteraceae bacterium]|nr:hypothetical protein [Bryobacteraceae bacterium]